PEKPGRRIGREPHSRCCSSESCGRQPASHLHSESRSKTRHEIVQGGVFESLPGRVRGMDVCYLADHAAGWYVAVHPAVLTDFQDCIETPATTPRGSCAFGL